MGILDSQAAIQFERMPPHSMEAEICLLGCLLLCAGDDVTFAVVGATVDAGSFFQPDHQIIFEAIQSIRVKGAAPNAMLLLERLRAAGVLEDVGGADYLGKLLASVPDPTQAEQWARIVREKFLLRQAIALSNDLLRDCYGPESAGGAIDLLVAAQKKISRLVQGAEGDGVKDIGAIVREVRGKMSSLAPNDLLPTGFPGIDAATGGIQIPELWVIGGRPSMGKSIIVKQIALRMARAGTPVALFSLEESTPKIGRNVLASEARVENNRIRRPHLMLPREWDAIDGAVEKLADLPLYVTHRVRTAARIAACLAALRARFGVRCVVVDYLQLVQAGGDGDFEQATRASRFVAELLKDQNVAGIVTAQLSRGLENQENKRPGMKDLRSTGQIEQDADGIFMLHREDYYHQENGYQPTHEAELICCKMRDGVRGETIRLRSELRYQTFDDIDAGTGRASDGEPPPEFGDYDLR